MFDRKHAEITRDNPELIDMFKIVVEGLVEQLGGKITRRELDKGTQDAEYSPGSYSIGVSFDSTSPASAAAVGAAMQKLSTVTGLKAYANDETCSIGLQGRNAEFVTRGLQRLARDLDQLGLPEPCFEKAWQAYKGSLTSRGRQIA